MVDKKIDAKKLAALIHRIGLKYNLTDEMINNLVNSPYLFAYEKIKELDLSEVTTEEELDEFKTNFYFKGLGKLHIPFRRVNRRNKQRESAQNINKKRWKN
tara:strand:- start:9468 stop:9770 length:303 start_codon:yes stop_codon:yes gene_type:complete